MSQGWKVWLLMVLLGVPALTRGQTLPEPPLPQPIAPDKPASLPDQNLPAPPATTPRSTRELPPLPPGFELPKPTASPDKPQVAPPNKPRPVTLSEEKVGPTKPGPSSKPDSRELPSPTPITKPGPPDVTPAIPDISGMPGGEDAYRPASWPPSVPAPVAPMPMPSPPPPPEHVGGPTGWVLFGDVLFWRPRLNEPQSIVAQVLGPNQFALRTVPWDGDYELAFRAGVGYLFSGGVYIWGEYTHFDNLVNVTSLIVPATPPHLITYNGPGLFHGGTANPTDTVGASWDLRYHTVDIMAGSVLSPTEFLDLIVAAGARLAQITHRFEAASFQGGGTGLGVERVQLDTEGAGPRFGLESRLYLWRGHTGWSLAFYGRSYGTLLFADSDETLEAVQFSGNTLTFNARASSSARRILPQVELALGGEWSLFGGRLIVAGGYEWLYWFDAASSNFSMLNSGSVQHQDLSFDGPFIRAILLW